MDESVDVSSDKLAAAPPVKSEIVASRVYFNGRNPRSVEIDDLKTAIAEPDALVWLGVKEPDDALLVQDFLDAMQAGRHERRFAARGVAALERVEFGDQMLHRGPIDHTRRRSC